MISVLSLQFAWYVDYDFIVICLLSHCGSPACEQCEGGHKVQISSINQLIIIIIIIIITFKSAI